MKNFRFMHAFMIRLKNINDKGIRYKNISAQIFTIEGKQEIMNK